MLEIAGGIIIAALVLFALYLGFTVFVNRRSMPQIGRGLIEGWRGFKDGMKGITDDPSKRK